MLAWLGDLQRKWYRNLLMKAFHLCVLLVAGPGVRDTQVPFTHNWNFKSTRRVPICCISLEISFIHYWSFV
jgi:hypothetical protein